jgi:hypothetical protein
VNDSGTHYPSRFLSNLTQAMKATAESAQIHSIEKVRAEAAAYVEHLRTHPDADAIREVAEADVATIKDRAKSQVERVRTETEQRIARRLELLQQELTEYNSAIELEIENVKERVANFQGEVARFFDQLLEGADPTVFASLATQMPDPPDFTDLDQEALTGELRARREHLAQSVVEETPASLAAQ